MDVLLIILIYMAVSLLISLGAKKARDEQQRKAEGKPEKDSLPVQKHEHKMMNGENDMTQGFFDQFPALWDAFEKQLKGQNNQQERSCFFKKATNFHKKVSFFHLAFWGETMYDKQ